jgi:16S rRNA G1207 methylase RsmC
MITIRHNHEDGTLVEGTSKGDGVYELIGPRTAARFRYFPSIHMIGIAQSRDHLAKRWQIEQARKALEAAGFDVTVEIDDTPRDVVQVKADRAAHLEDRYDALTAKAERRSAEAESRFAAADHYAERFAGGQPILVGHHSERGARVAQKRIDQNMRAGCDAVRKAEHTARAASVVGLEDARRERPDVIIRRIAKHEAELRKIVHNIDGTRPANDWRGAYYAPERTPASGEWLEQLEAARTYTQAQLDADRAALTAAEQAGYKCHSRETIHVGDKLAGRWQAGEVVRVNTKTVSVTTGYSWTQKVPYEDIRTVHCPHTGTDATVTMPAKPKRRPRPAVAVPAVPAERPAPVQVDARFEFFPTPAAVVAQMIDAARLEPGMTVLEPSAGAGAIAAPVHALGCQVDCVELSAELARRLGDDCYRQVVCANFLEYGPRDNPAGAEFYDRVIMNPPFARNADIAHVTHAAEFVRPGGMLVAVMSAGTEFRSDRATVAFRDLVAESGGSITALPDDAFKMSGTSVRTVLVTLPVAPKPAELENHPAELEQPAEPARVLEPAGMIAAYEPLTLF